ncbi:MAG TPA: hypothetical protein VGW34_13260 [Allosphingosinicella sp.]|nr:hypothetical protein [Allosphingosinicella sp.]
MIEHVAQPAARASLWPFAIIYLFTCILSVIVNFETIAEVKFPDPDDALRLQQVRDWIAGQSWFDLRQYRMNPPEGAPMHWSRLVDVPIAAMIVLLTPLLGSAAAEVAAMTLVPLLTLGAAMALIAAVTHRLLGREHAILAMLLVPVSVAVVHQLRPMRIDHHGWQMVLAAGALLAALDWRPHRSGLIVGALAAIWLTISLEGLPFAAALVALMAFRWLADPREGVRLVATAAGLAVTSLALFALTRGGGDWLINHCDQLSPVHLAMFGIGAGGCLAVSRLGGLPWWGRLLLLGGLGAAALAMMLAIAPQCRSGPFGSLDPLVREFWYERVQEGLPLWRQTPSQAATAIAFPLVGLFGSWRAFRTAAGERREAWAIVLFLLAAAMLTTVAVERAGSVANLLAVPGGAFIFQAALMRARGAGSLRRRAAATLAALLLIGPGHVVYAASLMLADQERIRQLREAGTCMDADELAVLSQLPPSDIAAPLDLSPAIVVLTGHRIIASGHHRNEAAMRDTIRLFTLPPDQAREVLVKRSIDYVAICPNLSEPQLYTFYAPRGLMALLERGGRPDWLEPVPVAGAERLRVWRVKAAR